MKQEKSSKKLISDMEFHSVSVVSHCPYCGTDKWDKPFIKKDGTICNHPTAFRRLK